MRAVVLWGRIWAMDMMKLYTKNGRFQCEADWSLIRPKYVESTVPIVHYYYDLYNYNVKGFILVFNIRRKCSYRIGPSKVD